MYPQEDDEEEDRMVPTWTLRIEGGVVDGNQVRTCISKSSPGL